MANSWKKKRDRYYNEKMRQYKEISDTYELDLKYEEYQPIAWDYADKKAQSERGWFSSLFSGGNIFKTLLTIVVAVVSIVVTWGSSTPAVVAWISTAASVIAGAYSLYTIHLSDKMLGLSIAANMIQSKIASLKNQTKAQAAKDQLTHLIIFNAYDIYANGAIFKANAPGSESISHSLGYDTSKGILGAYVQDYTDECINNREHANLAGNNGYLQRVLDFETPLKRFELSAEEKHDVTENQMRRANTRIATGFTKLNELYFNQLGTAESIYKRVFKEQIIPYQKRMVQDDFLDKIRNYNLGLRANFDFLNMYHFNNTPKTQKDQENELKKLQKVYADVQNSKEYTLEEKAWHYYSSISGYYEVLLGYSESLVDFYTDIVFLRPVAPNNDGRWIKKDKEKYNTLSAQIAPLEEAYKKATTYEEATKLAKEYTNIIEALRPIYNKYRYGFHTGFGSKPPLLSAGTHKLARYNLDLLLIPPQKSSINGIVQTIKPLATIPLKEILNKVALLSPSKSVHYYRRHIIDHFDNGNLIVANTDSTKGGYYGILKLTGESYGILSQSLPMAKELESFNWELLDVENQL